MKMLERYTNAIIDKGQPELATSITKTASEIGTTYLNSFDYRSRLTGLLFGNIQSGKTGQVFGVACEAVDRGFPFFLLLTTDTVLLQKQTFDRAKADLPDFVVCDENEEQKFIHRGEKPAMVVLKKNVSILKEWASILKRSQALRGNPLFIIDDEADAASLNTMVNTGKMSSINKFLNEIRDNAQSSIFLQVTGTPQALLLQSSDSGDRPDFTYYFEPGSNYLGGDFFFPSRDQTPDFIHFVDNKDSIEISKVVSLRHLVVSAQVMLSGSAVSNCIVHPGIKTDSHKSAKDDIEQALTWWTFHHKDADFPDVVKRIYNTISPKNHDKLPFNDILSEVLAMLENRNYSMVILNGVSNDDSENYESGCNFIFGGTNLGRGVTFKQLNTFYYYRVSKNPQADTMWQHSRIFGYDRDPGLISMYCTQELYQLFSYINETNNSIIEQVRSGEDIKIGYPDGIGPTRRNVLDKSLLNILAGGTNRFPVQPENHSFKEISNLVEKFGDQDPALPISLNLMLQILKHFKAEDNFNLKGYMDIIKAETNIKPLAQGRILVRRDRDITHGTRALLSPNDWAETNSYDNEFVLTLYCVRGQKDKGWNGWPVWVPNIKLPKTNNFFLIE